MAFEKSQGKFPHPPVKDVNADDPIMKRIKVQHLEIGARPSGMPKDMMDEGMGIQHVDSPRGKGG